MGHSNGIITPSISLPADVSYVLGAASADTGILCKHPNINMWAKHKPQHYDSKLDNDWIVNGKDIRAKYIHASGTTFWGVRPGVFYTSMSAFVNIAKPTITGGANGWFYDRPYGGENSPYRLTDFEGYCHKAPTMISSWRIDSESDNVQAGTKIVFSIRSRPINDIGITLYDIDDLSNEGDGTYVGLVAVKYTNYDSNTIKEYPYFKTSMKLGSGASADMVVIELDTTTFNGDYYVYPYLSNKAIGDTMPGSIRICTIPCTSPIKITVNKVEYSVIMNLNSFDYDKATYKIKNVVITVKNETGQTITVSNNRLGVAADNRGTNFQSLLTIADFTVGPNATKTINNLGDIQIGSGQRNLPYLYLTMGNASYVASRLLDLAAAPED